MFTNHSFFERVIYFMLAIFILITFNLPSTLYRELSEYFLYILFGQFVKGIGISVQTKKRIFLNYVFKETNTDQFMYMSRL
jgi:uncharacterized membrane protein